MNHETYSDLSLAIFDRDAEYLVSLPKNKKKIVMYIIMIAEFILSRLRSHEKILLKPKKRLQNLDQMKIVPHGKHQVSNKKNQSLLPIRSLFKRSATTKLKSL